MKKLLLLLLIPLAALAWWIVQKRSEPPAVAFARVKRETLASTLSTNGKVEPLEWESVRVEPPALVQKVLVHEGQNVAKGAVLAELTDTGLQSDLSAAEARLAQARAELATLAAGGKTAELTDIQNSLNRAKLDLEAAQREHASLRRLAEKQAATRTEVDAAREKVRQSEIEIQGLEQRRRALVGKNERTVAEAKIREGEAAVELARRRIAETVVRAPLSGVVYGLAVRAGSYLNAGDLVANVGRLDRLRVRVYVDEPELGRVEERQKVTITWDALPGKQWQGVVEKKPTSIVALGTRQVGEVLCTIENPDHELAPGSNVIAEILSNTARNALTIPKEAVRREGGVTGVFLLSGDTLLWRPMKLGASNVTRVQVIEGLNEGDAVALPTERALRTGERVRAVFP